MSRDSKLALGALATSPLWMYVVFGLISGEQVELAGDDSDVLFKIGLGIGVVGLGVAPSYRRAVGESLGPAAIIMLIILDVAGLGANAWGLVADRRDLEAALLPLAAGGVLPSATGVLLLNLSRILWGSPAASNHGGKR